MKRRLPLETTFNYWGKNMSKRNDNGRKGSPGSKRIAQNDLSVNEALHEISEERSSQRESILQQISALGDAEKLMSGDMATANERMEELKNQFAELSDSYEIAESKSLHSRFEQANWLSLKDNGDEDNKKRLSTLTTEFIDLYGNEAGPLMHQWVADRKNYFDFSINRPKEQPGIDNDTLAPSMKAIDNVTSAIKAYILARITHRMDVGDDHQNMTIRVTVDDGTERKHSRNS